ncbi:MAG: lysine--tRNA ligase [Mariprofundaceae bacterium]|nr:lysine--tRNA ligase [Mariprofundaceae bacterium]
MTQQPQDSEQVQVRRQKLQGLRSEGFDYPNNFRPSHSAASIIAEFEGVEKADLEERAVSLSIAGRIMSRRMMGQSSFVHIQDNASAIQLFLNKKVIGEDTFQAFKKMDIGDIVGVQGSVFRTKTDELSIRVSSIELVAKCLHPLPEKWHGLQDKETRYRQRYLDLIVNADSQQQFRMRSSIVSAMRRGLEERDFLEVETPMLQTQPGGAAARPFVTHHNALDMSLFLRIAPELYLKRLIVGGFNRVFEINRNFRNEGCDATHNPEFTMVEFYQAYADFHMAMDTTETLIQDIAKHLKLSSVVWEEVTIQFDQAFARLRLDETVFEKRPDLRGHANNKALLATVCLQEIPDFKPLITWKAGHYLLALFEHLVEPHISQPTFITHYPVDVSPLARRCPDEPSVTDRFELFIAGREIANGFSELNDPDDQRARFQAQVQACLAGDDEATPMDEDYIRALEYAMPPTAGVGIGVDRLVMMFCGQHAIRDILLFPHMRPE